MGTELIEIEKLNAIDVFKEGGLDTIIAKIEDDCRAIHRDPTTQEGRDNIRSLAAKIARTKTALDDVGKNLTADWKKKAREVDVVRSAAWDRLEALQKEIRKPLTDFEDAEKARVKAHNEGLAQMRDYEARSISMQTLEEFNAAIAAVDALLRRQWEEFAPTAAEVGEDVLKVLNARKAEREKYFADQAELARLRKENEERQQRERDEQIRREGEEAGREKERQRLEAARQANVPPSPPPPPTLAEREGSGETPSSTSKSAKAKVNKAAAEAFEKLGFSTKQGVAIITAIAQGKIPNVTIIY